MCYASAANVADVKAAPAVVVWVLEMFQGLAKILADQGYRSAAGVQQIQKAYDCVFEVVEHVQGKGFEPEPFRWVVERIWAWLENARALCRDYEMLPENHEGMIYVVMIRLMLRRIAKNQRQRELK